jgi:hypothetical protein
MPKWCRRTGVFFVSPCWDNGKFDVCNVACRRIAAAAQLAARDSREAKHERLCSIIGSLPVLAP